jgi:hypothetical protein
MNLIKVFENDDFVIDYDKENGRYRVSYFEDYHFKDECWFDEYKEEKRSLQEVIRNIEPISQERIRRALGQMETVDDIVGDIIGQIIEREKII